jgi:hypothetical protein
VIVIDEARTREAHPHLGGLLVAIQQAPQHETAWAHGADGEAQVAAALAKHLDSHTVVLRDRAIPGTQVRTLPPLFTKALHFAGFGVSGSRRPARLLPGFTH